MNNQDQDNKTEKVKGSAGSNDDKESSPDRKDSAGPDANANGLTPVKPKLGEGPGNLKRRSAWFQKRHGRG